MSLEDSEASQSAPKSRMIGFFSIEWNIHMSEGRSIEMLTSSLAYRGLGIDELGGKKKTDCRATDHASGGFLSSLAIIPRNKKAHLRSMATSSWRR